MYWFTSKPVSALSFKAFDVATVGAHLALLVISGHSLVEPSTIDRVIVVFPPLSSVYSAYRNY